MKLLSTSIFILLCCVSIFSQDLYFEEISPVKEVDVRKIFVDANGNKYFVTNSLYGDPYRLYRLENDNWNYKLSSDQFLWLEKISTFSTGQLCLISDPNDIAIYNPELNLLRKVNPPFEVEASCMFEDKLYFFAENAFWVSTDMGSTYNEIRSEVEAHTGKDLLVNSDGIYSTTYNSDQELFHFRKFDSDYNLEAEHFEDQWNSIAADLRIEDNVIFIEGINIFSTDSGISFENLDSPGYIREFENKSLFYYDNNELFKLNLETKNSVAFEIPEGTYLMSITNDGMMYVKSPDKHYEILDYDPSNLAEVKIEGITDFILHGLEINRQYIYLISQSSLHQYNLVSKELKSLNKLKNPSQLLIDSDNRINMTSLSDGVLYRSDEESFEFDTLLQAGYGFRTYIEKDSIYILNPTCHDVLAPASQFTNDGGTTWDEFDIRECIPYAPYVRRIGNEVYFYKDVQSRRQNIGSPLVYALFSKLNLDNLRLSETFVPPSIPFVEGSIVMDKLNRFQVNPLNKDEAVYGSYLSTSPITEFEKLPEGPNGHLFLGHDEISTYVINNDEGHPRFYFKLRPYEEYTELEVAPSDLPTFEYFSTLDNGDFVAATSSGRVFYAKGGSTSTKEAMLRTELNLFPNPASNQLNIITGDLNLEVANIYNLTGQLILSTNETSIDISELSAGTYLIETRYLERESSFAKFVKVEK